MEILPPIALDNLAVLIIDMQDFFLDSKKRKLIQPQGEVIKFCERKSVPIIVFEYLNRGDTTSLLKRRLDKISPQQVLYTMKSVDDAFSNPNLEFFLEKRNINALLLMGVNAGYCVYETACTALASNRYTVFTSQNLIGGYRGKYESPCKGPEWYTEHAYCFHDHVKMISWLSQE